MSESRNDVGMPDREELVRFALDECDSVQRSQVQRWLDAAGGRRPEMDRVLVMLQTLRTDESMEAPREAVRRAMDLMASQSPSAKRWWDTLPAAVASLLFDGRATAMVQGYRGGGTRGHIAYASDLGEIDLDLGESSKEDTEIDVRGQVDAASGQAGEVVFVLLRDPESSVTTMPDEQGMFRVNLLPGAYGVHCRLGDRVLSIPEIHIE